MQPLLTRNGHCRALQDAQYNRKGSMPLAFSPCLIHRCATDGVVVNSGRPSAWRRAGARLCERNLFADRRPNEHAGESGLHERN